MRYCKLIFRDISFFNPNFTASFAVQLSSHQYLSLHLELHELDVDLYELDSPAEDELIQRLHIECLLPILR